MIQWSGLAVEQWRAAEEAARLAERDLVDAAVAFTARRGPAPPESQWQEFKRLRIGANALLHQVNTGAAEFGAFAPAAETPPQQRLPRSANEAPLDTTAASSESAFAKWRASEQ